LGVSGAIALPFIRLFSKAKIITNIDGLEWKRDKWSTLAKKFLKFSEKLAVKYSDNVIADNQAIADYVVEEYECNAKVIAYGGDHAVGNELKIDNQGYALALCRIEPENNVEIILDGFSQSTTPLKFIGNWDSSEFGRLMKEKYSAFSHIEIIDPIYEVDKLQEFRQSCSFYVHGHSAGGTNPSLVEMMHFGKNILAYDCVYNRATTESKALFFKHAADMVSKINEFNSLENGEAMLAIAQRRYTWAIVKKQYFELME
jgi:glycosyltransferase involved in cell wall biosynthesis